MSLLQTAGQSIVNTGFGELEVEDRPAVSSHLDAVPLVFLQGLLAGPEAWSAVSDALAPDHRCVTVDWPLGSHRRPMAPGADLSPPGLARLVVEVLDQLGIEQAVLVGNDSGGVIAQLVLAAHPQRVAGLVLVACDAFERFPPPAYRPLFTLAGLPGTVRILSILLTNGPFARSRLGFGAVTRSHADALARGVSRLRANPALRRDLRKLLTGSSNRQTLAAADRFSSYEGPVLVVWAEEDRLFPRSLGERLAAAFPHGRLETVSNTLTFIPLDRPQQLTDLIEQWLHGPEPA